MKKLGILLLMIVVNINLGNAQIVITQSDMPSVGDTLRVSTSNDTLNPAMTGANYTWDYSYLKPTQQHIRKFDSPTTFVIPFNLFFGLYNTSFGEKNYTPDSITGVNIHPSNSYDFYRKSTSSYRKVGQGLKINAAPIPFLYHPVDTIFRFPLKFGDSDSCDSEFGLTVPNVGYFYGQKIHRVNHVDGWGVLTTPYGTFPSLRIKSEVSVRDTFADSSGVNGYAINRPVRYEYSWLTVNGKIPYLTVTANRVAGKPVVSNIEYRDSMRIHVSQLGIANIQHEIIVLKLFPNPCIESSTLVIPNCFKSFLKLSIKIFDAFGKEVHPYIVQANESVIISRSQLSKGFYFVNVSDGEKVGICKWFIQ